MRKGKNSQCMQTRDRTGCTKAAGGKQDGEAGGTRSEDTRKKGEKDMQPSNLGFSFYPPLHSVNLGVLLNLRPSLLKRILRRQALRKYPYSKHDAFLRGFLMIVM